MKPQPPNLKDLWLRRWIFFSSFFFFFSIYCVKRLRRLRPSHLFSVSCASHKVALYFDPAAHFHLFCNQTVCSAPRSIFWLSICRIPYLFFFFSLSFLLLLFISFLLSSLYSVTSILSFGPGSLTFSLSSMVATSGRRRNVFAAALTALFFAIAFYYNSYPDPVCDHIPQPRVPRTCVVA